MEADDAGFAEARSRLAEARAENQAEAEEFGERESRREEPVPIAEGDHSLRTGEGQQAGHPHRGG